MSEMEDMSIVTQDELDHKSYKKGKPDWKPSGDDPVADILLKYYYIYKSDRMSVVRLAIYALPLVLILAFALFISNTTSNIIAFTSLIISLSFIAVSFHMLCWILDKDPGSRPM
jgi:hypothetical protein